MQVDLADVTPWKVKRLEVMVEHLLEATVLGLITYRRLSSRRFGEFVVRF
jgi:hypothetical protein